MPSSSTSSLPLAFRLSNQSPTSSSSRHSRRQNGHGNGSRAQPQHQSQQQKKQPKHREEAEELELKKRKMRQMVAIYSKQKSAADLKPPKPEATGGRKKCKNPNCRCRERRKRKEKHQEERQPENGATTTENVPKRAAEEVQQEVKMGAEKEKAAGKDVEMPMAKENGGGAIGTENSGFDGQNQQWQNNGHLGEQQGQQQQQQWNTVDERAARMAVTFCFHDIRAQMLADCFRCLNSVSSSFSQHLLLSAQRDHYEIEKRLPKLMARFSQGQLDILGEKRKQLEKSYKLNCVTTGLVSRKLLLKDPALEEQLKQPLLAVMADFEADTWAEMDQFIEGLLL